MSRKTSRKVTFLLFQSLKRRGGGTYPSHMGTSRDCKVTLVSSCNVKGPQGNAGQPME